MESKSPTFHVETLVDVSLKHIVVDDETGKRLPIVSKEDEFRRQFKDDENARTWFQQITEGRNVDVVSLKPLIERMRTEADEALERAHYFESAYNDAIELQPEQRGKDNIHDPAYCAKWAHYNRGNLVALTGQDDSVGKPSLIDALEAVNTVSISDKDSRGRCKYKAKLEEVIKKVNARKADLTALQRTMTPGAGSWEKIDKRLSELTGVLIILHDTVKS